MWNRRGGVKDKYRLREKITNANWHNSLFNKIDIYSILSSTIKPFMNLILIISCQVIENVVKFLKRYATEIGLPKPAAPFWCDNWPPIYLPASDSKVAVLKRKCRCL